MVDDSQAKTSAHAVLAAVLQVRDGRLQALLWQRAREPFATCWALPGGALAADETLEESMRRSLSELDGVFTYICVTEDALGVAKDELGAKPLVLYESDDIVALASEEIAIRKVVDREIETYDPYEGAVMVWTR